VLDPIHVVFVFETKSFEWIGKASTPDLNGYDIFVALRIDVQSFSVAFGMISLPLLNQRVSLSGGVTLPSGYGENAWPCPVIGRVSLRPMTASPKKLL
jgi:hypothetical protein